MDYKKLANLLYPNAKDIEFYEKKYPERNLDNGAEVCRFAPSPTGRIHMGNLFASFIPEVFAHQSNGVFILRIEDTDQVRILDNGVELIYNDLKTYNYQIDESPLDGGEYGPYVQTERKEIYESYAKYLVSIGRAYPCFCSAEDLDEMRHHQEERKEQIGYYGRYAKCRNLSLEDVEEHLKNGDKFVLRLKSMGDPEKKFIFKDLVKGTIELPQNNLDQVLIKSDGIPPYAFAHVVDDHLMHTTIVTRDDSYISSVPYHMELWDAFGFKKPKFAHLLPINKKDGDIIRKISKRKDPEAAISYHHEKGIPVEAVKLYFATLLNSNFEGWLLQNPDKSYRDFKFTFDKMSKSGSLFDMEKLINISKNYLSKLKASEVFDLLDTWSKEFDPDFNELINKYKEYTINVLNIEREQKKPRKDFAFYSEIKPQIWYMFDELFEDAEYDFGVNSAEQVKEIINHYYEKYYNDSDDKETWFNKIKELSEELGYASDMKAYKENPEGFKGSVADISNIIRIALTTKSTTPDLYEIMRLLGKDRVQKRFKKVISM